LFEVIFENNDAKIVFIAKILEFGRGLQIKKRPIRKFG
jgi:hypothetical protein